MDTSFVEFRGKGFWERDGWIRDLLSLLMVELEARGARKRLGDLWEHWTLQAHVILPGSHDVGLDVLVTDEPTRQLLVECCEAVARRTGKVERRRPRGFDHADRELFEEGERLIDTDGVRPLALQLARLLRGEAGGDPRSEEALHWRERGA